MWYTYLLESVRNKRFYVGVTSNLTRRVREHNSKRGGVYTSKSGPFTLIFYEAYLDKKDAENAERFFKSGYGREVLRGKIANYLSLRD